MDNTRSTKGGGGGGLMAWNVFKFCTWLRCLGSIMIIIVLCLVGVTYYVVVVANYGPTLLLHGSITAFLILFLFHALLAMVLWSYFSVVFTDPGHVPLNWTPKFDEEKGSDDHADLLPESAVDAGGQTQHCKIRYCRKCNHFKPPRCHHCSVCGRCILKMDHHCIWVVNCVGAFNYKYFLLFVLYTFFGTTLVTVSLLPYFLIFFTDEEISGSATTIILSFVTFVLNLAFAISLLGFMILHIILVIANTTTVEGFEKKSTPKWHYDLGWKKNFEQVFGTNKWYWFIPAYSKEDLRRMPELQGLEYPTQFDVESLQKL
ncbi:probable protein S-acyltransferase 14 [Arachis ipaensis]|uniref:probable protein S-acyltransferase 14 n=1 Tax=Arachis ipaensis TaxID=130454 RepID=UPI000A2B7914|nr:probable protein S-acyltransferase 14 [Arachis ipaensis]XP_025631052.1 probable protein S-acyltransferase 14 [Arachis hypogaea]